MNLAVIFLCWVGGMPVLGLNNDRVYLDRDLYIDFQRLILVGGNFSISLSVTQSLILRKLSEHLDRPVSTEDIVGYVWNSQVQKSELYKQINRIREKIEPNQSKSRYLLTVRGFGYLLHTYEHLNRDE